MTNIAERATEYFASLQDRLVAGLESLDGNRFREDLWQYSGRGGGRTRVLAEGGVFEKGGVNFSDVAGEFPADFAAHLPGDGLAFRAMGVSLVLHPRSPMIPTVHCNFRYIQRGASGWFGGGADLTPYFPDRDDCIHFHRSWRDVCRRHANVADYPAFKKWCDEYFYLKHRNEPRGIGGIFFDYLKDPLESAFDFVRDAGDSFLNAYGPIVERRRNEKWGEEERRFQSIRRGRYVEFNLIHDRGTLFGLRTGGRIESILMSLPPSVAWEYDYRPPAGSRAEELADFLIPRDWASESTSLEMAKAQ